MNFKRFFLLSITILSAFACQAALKVQDLRCVFLKIPLGFDASIPRLSWTLTSSRRGEMQT